MLEFFMWSHLGSNQGPPDYELFKLIFEQLVITDRQDFN
jgi:hypothetical protein